MGPIDRRAFLAAATAAASCAPAGAARAADYPARPIRFVVPFTPGAGTDRTARLLAQHLTPMLGKPVVVENRGGASGTIGTDLVAKAAPDGYTWLLGHDPPLTINQHFRQMPYAITDFAPVSLLTRVPLVLVARAGLPVTSLEDLVKMAREAPGKLTISNSGNGSSGHLAAALFLFVTKTEMLHVPYKGQAEAIADVLGGRIDLNFTAIPNILSHARAGKLKVIANASPARFPGLPDVPTISEAGYPGFDASAFHALLMPRGTPTAVIEKVNADVDAVLAMPEVTGTLGSLGLTPVGGKPERLAELLKADSERWGQLIRDAGITAD